jgi:hypothetical protein
MRQKASLFARNHCSLVALPVLALFLICPVLQAQQPQLRRAPQAAQDNLPPEPPATDSAPEIPMPIPPTELTVPAGTFVTVRLMGSLSSDVNQAGDGFSATLEQPVVVDGWVVARRGQIAVGHVVQAQKAGRVRGVSSLAIALSDISLVNGRQVQVTSQLVQTSAGTSKGRDALALATTTGMGAAIGGAIDGGPGAGIGAGVGAAVGIAGVLLTPGRPTVMSPETLLTFRLEAPITINTQRSTVAFLPATQDDFGGGVPAVQPRPAMPAYPVPPAYPVAPVYPYVGWPYWAGWGFYPSVSFVGYYGGYHGGHSGHWH